MSKIVCAHYQLPSTVYVGEKANASLKLYWGKANGGCSSCLGALHLHNLTHRI